MEAWLQIRAKVELASTWAFLLLTARESSENIAQQHAYHAYRKCTRSTHVKTPCYMGQNAHSQWCLL